MAHSFLLAWGCSSCFTHLLLMEILNEVPLKHTNLAASKYIGGGLTVHDVLGLFAI